jgi:hypothetical protein
VSCRVCGERGAGATRIAAEANLSVTMTLLPLQPDAMTPAQLAAVSYLARYSGHTHALYAYQLRRWFGWCESNGLDALVGVQRAHVELYIRYLRDCGLRDSSICTMMHGVRGFFRFAHIDGCIPADPAVYVRLPKIHADETRTQGLDRLELIRFLQVAQTISVHHGALVDLLGINALRVGQNSSSTASGPGTRLMTGRWVRPTHDLACVEHCSDGVSCQRVLTDSGHRAGFGHP